MEWIEYPWQEVLTGVAITFSLVFSMLLVLNKYPSSKWLGFICLSYALLLGSSTFLVKTYSLVGLCLFSTTLFLFTRSFFRQKRRISWLHILPFFSSILLVSFLGESVLARIGCSIICATYFLLTIRFMRQEGDGKGITWFSNPGNRLVWFRNFVMANLAFGVTLGAYPSIPSWILSGVIIFLIGFILYQLLNESTFLTPHTMANKYQKSTLSPSIKVAILDKLDVLFEKEKFYLRDDASLPKLSEALGATTHHVSQVLNESKQMSFQELMTQYRIRESKRLLRDPEQQKLKIETIASMVGYNSKSAFNTAFKRYSGYTPSEFKSLKHVASYREEHLPGRKDTDNRSLALGLNHHISIKTKSEMVQNTIKSFLRNLKKNKLFSAINLFGLTLAFLCSLLIYLYVSDELAYDKLIPDSDRILRITWINDNPQTHTPHPLAQALKQDWPEVEQAVSITPWYDAGLNKAKVLVEHTQKNISFEETDFYFADSTFFDVFGIEVVDGDPDALSKPWTLVITEEMAYKYFGDERAVGKELSIIDGPTIVSTVVKGLPKNSHFHFQAILPYMTLKAIHPANPWLSWGDFGHFNYIKLKEDADPAVLQENIPEWIIKQHTWDDAEKEDIISGKSYFDLQPVTEIHLNSHLRWELEGNGNILYIHILTGTLIFLLVIAGINYVNMTTAKSLERAKEIGIRKTLGAITRSLSVQFYMEAVVFCSVAGILAFLLAAISLDLFNSLTQKTFHVDDLLSASIIVRSFLVMIIIGLLSGVYPALVLSSFKPADVLKGKLTTSSKGVALRGVLVTLQFTISAILIAGSLIIVSQVDYMRNKPLGFDQEAVLYMPIVESVEVGGIDMNKLKLAEERIRQLKGVLAVSTSSNIPGTQFNHYTAYLENNPENQVDAAIMMQGFGLMDVLEFQLIAGRDFDKSFATDSSGTSLILNEKAAAALNLTDPISKKVVWLNNNEELMGTVVGIVEDFHFRSLHESIEPLILQIDPYASRNIIVKGDGKNMPSLLATLEDIYTDIYPNNPFTYQFLDEELGSLYSREQKTLTIFSVFAGIALILACLGLLGMAYTMLHQRVKEIGLRKIMGASAVQIAALVLGQFIRMLMVAALIGLPVAYLLMENWLMEFSYRAPLSATPFASAIAILLSIAILSVSSAVTKMATSRPIDSLRYE